MNAHRQKLVLALPSKGRLQEQCINFLSGCGFDVRRVGNGREYVARLVGVDDVDVIYLRPEEIPSRVEQGDAHAGMTGEDLYREYGEGRAGVAAGDAQTRIWRRAPRRGRAAIVGRRRRP